MIFDTKQTKEKRQHFFISTKLNHDNSSFYLGASKTKVSGKESPIQSKASSALRKSSKYCSACSQGLMENASSCYSFFRRGGHWDLTPLLIVHSSLNPNLWRKLVCLILTGFTPPLKEFYSSNVQLDIRSHRLPGGVFYFLGQGISSWRVLFLPWRGFSSMSMRFHPVEGGFPQ